MDCLTLILDKLILIHFWFFSTYGSSLTGFPVNSTHNSSYLETFAADTSPRRLRPDSNDTAKSDRTIGPPGVRSTT
ncbi:unnamed protein product [Clavelina lepadiformis]|uniref:Secreted protein n=1 Tax=Clavelina lepadiformis TaxID=159417 RepID=A0ABP0GYA0_CLALP